MCLSLLRCKSYPPCFPQRSIEHVLHTRPNAGHEKHTVMGCERAGFRAVRIMRVQECNGEPDISLHEAPAFVGQSL